MTENRTDRTTNLGLLALMQAPGGGGPPSSAQGWGFPYWNQVWLDALVAALHEAARTGVAAPTAPATAPTLDIIAYGGSLPGGLTLEVCQTWVDQWGRETNAGPVEDISTGEGITNPAAAPTLGTPTAAASGFDGGLLEVAYSWIDTAAGETLASPVAQIDVPYRTGGLKSVVPVTLPATPASVGAAGAFIYARHRSGNWVRAAAITSDDETEALLDGTWISCFVALPQANSTGTGKSLSITGQEAPEMAARTRFYIRRQGDEWTAGDHRLRIGSVGEWDATTVSYPLIFAGTLGQLAPGYPPPVSQVLPIRPVDLSTEVNGVLPREYMEDVSGVDVRIATVSSGQVDWEGALAEPGRGHGDVALVIPDYTANGGERLGHQAVLYFWNAQIATPAWEVLSPILPTQQWTAAPFADYDDIPGTVYLRQNQENGRYLLRVRHAEDYYQDIPLTLYGPNALGDYLGWMGVYNDLESLNYEGEPWNSDYVLAYVVDTKSLYRYIWGEGWAEEIYSGSRPYSCGDTETSCDGESTVTFTVAMPGQGLITKVSVTAVSEGNIDYKLELFSNSERTVLEYQAGGASGEGIDTMAYDDRIPWEWFGGDTVYATLTNHSPDALTAILVSIKYRI